MNVRATRDSVAAGDDADAPHLQVFAFADSTPVSQVVAGIVARRYLASIVGGRATWSVASGVPLMVVAQQWSEPRPVYWSEPALPELDWREGALCIQFNYHAQTDPELVLQVLKRVRLRSP